jgi:phage shock protein A
MEIKRYIPKVDDRWVAAYLLNKRIAASKWREYATAALQEASKKYLEDLKAKDPEAFARAIAERKKSSKKRTNTTSSSFCRRTKIA